MWVVLVLFKNTYMFFKTCLKKKKKKKVRMYVIHGHSPWWRKGGMTSWMYNRMCLYSWNNDFSIPATRCLCKLAHLNMLIRSGLRLRFMKFTPTGRLKKSVLLLHMNDFCCVGIYCKWSGCEKLLVLKAIFLITLTEMKIATFWTITFLLKKKIQVAWKPEIDDTSFFRFIKVLIKVFLTTILTTLVFSCFRFP